MRSRVMTLATVALVSMVSICASPSVEASDEWVTNRANPSRTGLVGNVQGPGTGAIIWRYQPESLTVAVSPAYADGRVFFGDGEGYVYALDALTGQELWKVRKGRYVVAGPVVSNETVFVGSLDVGVLALDAATGRELWNTSALGDLWLADGLLYIASGDTSAVDPGSGHTFWQRDDDRGDTAPMAVGDRLFVPQPFGFRALNLTTGQTLASWPELTFVTADLAADEEILVVVSDAGKNVTAIHARDLTIMWTSQTGQSITAEPVVANGTVFLGSYTGMLLGLSASTGAKVLELRRPEGFLVAPVVARDYAFLVSVNGVASAIDLSSGTTVWTRPVGVVGESSPILVNGTLYFGVEGAFAGAFYALDAGSGLDDVPFVPPSTASPRGDTPGPSVAAFVLGLLVTMAVSIRARKPR